MLVVSAAVGFLLWYTVVREAHEIQPLVPALKSWWMKLHVPANFIGYGTFALSAMVNKVEPTGNAKFVEFVTLADPKQMPYVKSHVLDWPCGACGP